MPQIRLLSILLRSPLVIQLIHSPPLLVVSWKNSALYKETFGINARDMLRAYKVVCFLRVFLVNVEIWCDKTPPHTTSLHSSSCTISWNNDKIQEWRPILYNFQFEVTANAFFEPLSASHSNAFESKLSCKKARRVPENCLVNPVISFLHSLGFYSTKILENKRLNTC